MTQLTQLYFSWDELEVLARLVDVAIGRSLGEPAPFGTFNWSMLNSLRTALREAQYPLLTIDTEREPTDEDTVPDRHIPPSQRDLTTHAPGCNCMGCFYADKPVEP